MTWIVPVAFVLGVPFLLWVMRRRHKARSVTPAMRVLGPMVSSPYRQAGRSRGRGF
jgi:hypothetical protein